MRYIIIMMSVMVAGSMHNAWGMDSIQEKAERDKLLAEAHIRNVVISEDDLKKSNKEIEKLLENKRKNSNPTTENLVRLRLIAEGFCDGSNHKGD